MAIFLAGLWIKHYKISQVSRQKDPPQDIVFSLISWNEGYRFIQLFPFTNQTVLSLHNTWLEIGYKYQQLFIKSQKFDMFSALESNLPLLLLHIPCHRNLTSCNIRIIILPLPWHDSCFYSVICCCFLYRNNCQPSYDYIMYEYI